MKPKTNVALAVLIPSLLVLVLVVAACGGEEATTTTRAVTTATQAVTTTTQAAVTTTQTRAPVSALDAARKTKLDEFLRQLEENNKAMGGVVIAQDGQVVYENYIGSASVADGIRNSQLTKFRIGSVTKMFTATMILQLIEEGRLTLDTKLAAFYPQIQNSEAITISEMLSHRSGIHSFTDDPEIEQYAYTGQSKEQMVARIAGMKPDFEPDEQFAYSNSNYVLLGYIIEDITHSTYQQELGTRIVDRIGLANTEYGNAIDTRGYDAASYATKDGQWVVQRESDMSVPGGAGAIVSTPRDLAAFISALFNNKLITEESLNQMLEMKDGYGKGIFPVPVGDEVGYGHNGQADGFSSQLAYYPNEKVAIAVLANGVDGDFDDGWTGISRIYFGLPFEIPDFTPLPAPAVAGTLAFVNLVGGLPADIYVVNTDGTGLRPITETPDYWEEHPSWSPDGRRIVYDTFIPGEAVMDTVTVWVASADGSERVKLSEGNGFFPTWSPDGKQVVYVAVDSEVPLPFGVLVINADGSGARKLTDTEVLAFPSWTPNGEILFLRDGTCTR